MAKKIPYLLAKAVGALKKYKNLSDNEAFRQATATLQAVGLLKPRSQDLTRFGKKLEKSMKLSKRLRKKDGKD